MVINTQILILIDLSRMLSLICPSEGLGDTIRNSIVTSMDKLTTDQLSEEYTSNKFHKINKYFEGLGKIIYVSADGK